MSHQPETNAAITIEELIEVLQELPKDKKIYVTQWYKRNSEIMPLMNRILEVKGIGSCIDQDTNEEIYYIESIFKE